MRIPLNYGMNDQVIYLKLEWKDLLKKEFFILQISQILTRVKCIKGKFVKTNKKGATRSTGRLELIHTDISGPYTPGLGGHKYFITFIDDYSRYGYIYLLHEKS